MKLQEQFEKQTGNLCPIRQNYKRPMDYDSALIAWQTVFILWLNKYCQWLESRIESLQSANQLVRVKDRLPTVYLSDLLDVIHFTIIKKLGRNDFLLKQVQEMEYIIKYEMGNLDVNDTEMWNSIINKYMSAAPVKEGEG